MFDKAEIEIPCGNCGRKTKKTVAWLKSHDRYICTCGTNITVDATQFVSELNKVDKAVDDLKRTIKRFSR